MRKVFWTGLILSLILGFNARVHAAEPVAEPMLEKVPSRPNPDKGPTQVEVGIWLLDIDSINSAQQNFVVNVFVVLQWKDPRLAHGPKGSKRYSALDVWTPRAHIANEIGIVRKTMADIVDVEGDGTVIYRQRYVGSLSQPLNLRDFPFDKHLFRIHLMTIAAQSDEIQFVPLKRAVEGGLKQAAGISPDISLPDWTVESFEARPLAYRFTQELQTPGYALEFIAKRDSRYFVWKVIFPLILIVIMSWSAFWIDPKEVNTNITAVMTSMLTLVAYRFTIDRYLPSVGYLTRMDKFVLWSTVMVFLSLIQAVVNSRLAMKGEIDLARRIDRWARAVYPSIFVLITVFSLWIG